MAVYSSPLGLNGRASPSEDMQMERNLELFRRILESLAKEPVDIISEPDYLMGMRQCRVHFRYSQFYMMVDINVMRYGDVPVERLAHDCYERMMEYRRKHQMETVNMAYQSMRDWKPDWKKQPDPRATPEDNLKAKVVKQVTMDSLTVAIGPKVEAPVGSFENPYRVELQKKVDAWLK